MESTEKLQELYQNAAEVLRVVVEDENVKLHWGAQQRQVMKESIQKNPKFTNYRTEWLHAASLALVKALLESSKEFHAKNPQDRLSVRDFMDALSLANIKLKKQTED